MSLIKSIDSKLMRLFTYNFSDRDWSKTPASFARDILFLTLFIAATYFLNAIFFDEKFKFLEFVLAIIFLIFAFYYFRLWRRLKAEHIE